MTEFLRNHARVDDSYIRLPVPLHTASLQGREKLSEKAVVLFSKAVLRNRRRMFSKKHFLEIGRLQSSGDITCERSRGGEGDISVLRSHGRMRRHMGQRMKPVQPVGPASDNH